MRGARQVGKTWLIRNLAQVAHKEILELNFEKRPDLLSLFSSNDPAIILTNIAAFLKKTFDKKETLLFLDEIQVAPSLLAKLRWFAEEMPELAVVAAGSLLDFALAEHTFSMPVGRISYAYLEPLSFEEFLSALHHQNLRAYLKGFQLGDSIPSAIHDQLLSLIKEYLLVGGMPAALSLWTERGALEYISQAHFDLLTTYREDFAKYRGRLAPERLEEIFASVPRQLGQKFVYAQANPETSTPPLKQALDLLVKARVCHQIFASSSNGLPLDAEIKDKFFKTILLDCGLANATLGLSLHQLDSISELTLVNNGGVAEQFVGQQLRTLFPPFVPPTLHYWQRTDRGTNAEVDYVIAHGNNILPVEVKAGTTGSLKSLHEFMHQKGGKLAIRINSDLPTLGPVDVKTSRGERVRYTLLSLPFYLIGQLHRLIAMAEDSFEKNLKRFPGAMRDKLSINKDFDGPLPEDILSDFQEPL